MGFQAWCESSGTSSGLEAPCALHGPGLLLMKRSFGGDREHYVFSYYG